MAMRRREQTEAAEAISRASSDALTERWYELRNLVDSLRAKETRIAELATRLSRAKALPADLPRLASRAQAGATATATARRG